MSEFIDYLHEVFAEFGPIRARRMFGGFGIYRDDVMFALVADDVLYLKADEESMREFESRGLGRFAYDKGGTVVTMSYYEAPVEIYDDPDDAGLWARRAFDAALRAKSRNRRARSDKR